MRIPQEKIDEVRNAIDIVDLIGGFVKLKKRGKNFLGLCPFHTEKTPSFNVSPDRQMYHCFGCGVGGNVFTFVMEYEKVSFLEAVRSLAEKAGIALPQGSSADDQVVSEQEDLYNICREAGLFYYKALTESGEGKFAVDYFHKRGFTDETIRTFGLGYAPNSWDAIIQFGEQKSFSSVMLEKAGLARKRDDGTYFDYFRGRAMFPIFSSTGRVVGFGARKLREDDPLGKYINSPETLIYNKSKILYGLYQSKETIREKDFAVLVEGYADLISVFQAGIKNIVASSGTALTVEQILLISRYTKNITIMYDADSAGSSAALRGVDLILEHDLDVRVASLPEGDDPDSFVKKNGSTAFQKILDEAVSFVDFIAQAYERQGKLKTPEGQAQVVRTIIQTIAKMKDELKRNFYIKRVAEKYKLYESTLYRELEKTLGTTGRQQRMRSVSAQSNENVSTTAKTVGAIPPAEKELLLAMLEGGADVVQFILSQIDIESLDHPETKKLIKLLLDRIEEGMSVDANALMDETKDDSLRRLIADIVFNKYTISNRWEKASSDTERAPQQIAEEALSFIKREQLQKIAEDNLRQLKEASKRGENVDRYLERNKQLLDEIKSLEKKV